MALILMLEENIAVLHNILFNHFLNFFRTQILFKLREVRGNDQAFKLGTVCI